MKCLLVIIALFLSITAQAQESYRPGGRGGSSLVEITNLIFSELLWTNINGMYQPRATNFFQVRLPVAPTNEVPVIDTEGRIGIGLTNIFTDKDIGITRVAASGEVAKAWINIGQVDVYPGFTRAGEWWANAGTQNVVSVLAWLDGNGDSRDVDMFANENQSYVKLTQNALDIVRITSEQGGGIGLVTTNGLQHWHLRRPDNLTNSFVVIPPTNHPVAGQVMAVRSYALGTISLDWINEGAIFGNYWTNDGVVLKATPTGTPPKNALRFGTNTTGDSISGIDPSLFNVSTNVGENTIGFGSNILVESRSSSVLGGYRNEIAGDANTAYAFNVIAGGSTNFMTNASHCTISGGNENDITGNSTWSTVGGGWRNDIVGAFSTISGGGQNTITTDSGFIGGGQGHNLSGSTGFSVIAGGSVSSIDGSWSAICGGQQNAIHGEWGFIGGGFQNFLRGDSGSDYSVIVGGQGNDIGDHPTGESTHAFIGGGEGNNIDSDATASTVVGGKGNGIASNNEYAFVGGGLENAIGQVSTAGGSYSVIVGGAFNFINRTGTNAFIGGGRTNHINTDGHNSVLVGGLNNWLTNRNTFTGGGVANTNGGAASVLVGGWGNNIYAATNSVIGGGTANLIGTSGAWSVIPGGASNNVNATGAWAIGNRATNALSFAIDIAPNGDTTKTTFTGSNTLYRTPILRQLQGLTYSGTNVTVDWSLGDAWRIVLTNNTKFWFTNTLGVIGSNWMQRGTIDLVQDGTGSRLFFWNNVNIQTNVGNPLVLTTAANSVDKLMVQTDSTGTNFQIFLQKTWLK